MMRLYAFVFGLLVFLPLTSALDVHGGWPVSTEFTIWGPPIVADVDGDGRGDLVVARTRADKSAQVDYAEVLGYREDGTQLFVYSEQGRCDPKCNAPAVGDVDGDGTDEIVVSYLGGRILVFATSGALETTYTLSGETSLGPAALGDVDGDSSLEIIIASSAGSVYAIRGSDGAVIWSYPTGSTIDATALALGELDNIDNGLEVAVGDGSGNIHVIRNGAALSGWPKSTGAQIIGGAPSLGDINDDGGIDVIVGSVNGVIHAWSYDGTSLSGWPKQASGFIESQPTLGDIDGDGKLEVVISTVDNGVVYAIRGTGSVLPGFPTVINELVRAPLALGDIDGGGVEIILMTQSGKLYFIKSDGTKSQVSQEVGTAASSAPAMWDIDGDGLVEIAMGGSSGFYVWDTVGSSNFQALPWPMFRRDSRNTGMYSPVAKINSPSPGATYTRLDEIQFTGKGLSSYAGINSYSWSSNLTGSLGSANAITKSFSQMGTQLITLKVVDDDDREDATSTEIEITNLPPSVSILAPSGSSTFNEGETIKFEGSASDPEGDSISSYEWRSSIDGVIGTAVSFSVSKLSLGSHIINFTATDQYGANGTTSTVLIVNPSLLKPLAPSALILSPANGASFYEDEVVVFSGSGSDVDGVVTGYKWVSNVDGLIGNSPNFTTDALSMGYHTITLSVTDNDGISGRDSVGVLVTPLRIGVSITSPVDDAKFSRGVDVFFNSSVVYPFSIVPRFTWSSDLGGFLSNEREFASSELGVGVHNISLLVTDGGRAVGRSSINIKVLSGNYQAITLPIARGGELAKVVLDPAKASGLLSIEIMSTLTLNNATLEVESLDKLPSTIKEPKEFVYKYMRITFNTTFVKQASINFRVPVSWLKENDVEANGIFLMRYVQDSWEILSNIKTGEDGLYAYYSAETPGFSYFAIAARRRGFDAQPIESIRKGIEDARKQLGNIVTAVDKKKLYPVVIGVALLLGWYFILRKGSVLEYAKRIKK